MKYQRDTTDRELVPLAYSYYAYGVLFERLVQFASWGESLTMKRAFEMFYFRLWLEILSVLSVWVEGSLVDCNGDVIIGSDRRTNRDRIYKAGARRRSQQCLHDRRWVL